MNIGMSMPVDQAALLSLITIGLNRPLMEERVLPQVTLLGRLPQDVLIPVSRRETFSVGVEGSREYRQRTVHYSFRPTKPGLLFLGPFEVQQGEQRLQTSTVVLQVLDTESAPFESSSFVGLERPELFFRAPSTDDGRLDALHEASSDQAILLDPLATEAVEATWPLTRTQIKLGKR